MPPAIMEMCCAKWGSPSRLYLQARSVRGERRACECEVHKQQRKTATRACMATHSAAQHAHRPRPRYSTWPSATTTCTSQRSTAQRSMLTARGPGTPHGPAAPWPQLCRQWPATPGAGSSCLRGNRVEGERHSHLGSVTAAWWGRHWPASPGTGSFCAHRANDGRSRWLKHNPATCRTACWLPNAITRRWASAPLTAIWEARVLPCKVNLHHQLEVAALVV